MLLVIGEMARIILFFVTRTAVPSSTFVAVVVRNVADGDAGVDVVADELIWLLRIHLLVVVVLIMTFSVRPTLPDTDVDVVVEKSMTWFLLCSSKVLTCLMRRSPPLQPPPMISDNVIGGCPPWCCWYC